MDAVVLDRDGLLLVGTLHSIEPGEDAGSWSSVLISVSKWNGEKFERRLLFSTFDQDTGERSGIDADLAEIAPGTPVAVGVKPQVSKKNTVYLTAVTCSPLQVSSESALPRSARRRAAAVA